MDVKHNKLGIFAGEYAAEEELDKINGRSLGTDVSGVSNILTCNGDVCAVGV